MNGSSVDITEASSQSEFAEARKLILEYAVSLGFDLSFQNFDEEINRLSEIYAAPQGVLLCARADGEMVGVAGVRRFSETDCELKRMYVQPGYRHHGVGRLLLEQAIRRATESGYRCIRLDTDATMDAAIALYLQYGFIETAAYRYNPHQTARYFELQLQKTIHP